MTNTLSTPRLHVACAVVAMLALHSCIPEPACAATPLQLRWTAELSDPKPYNAVLFAGESADLQATLKLYGRAVALEDTATAALYYQTNGMGSAWWQSPATVTTAGVVTASWTPALDAGADLYRWHLGVANAASSTVYRAFGAFRMQPSPGAAPNVLAPPVRWIDFDLVAISNAPWATPADLAAATNGLLRAEADPLSYAPATNALALASTALQPGATNGLLRAEADTLETVTARGNIAESMRVLYKSVNTDLSDGVFRIVDGGEWEYGETDMAVIESIAPADAWSAALSGERYAWLWQYSAQTPLIAALAGAEYEYPDINGMWRLWITDMYGSFVQYQMGSGRVPSSSAVEINWVGTSTTNSVYSPVASTHWVESIMGIHADIATNVVYHVVVSNGHWLIREVQ